MYLQRIPKAIQRLSSALWSMDDEAVYLTFDDGPSSKSEELLQVLDNHGIDATFFILGRQAELYPKQMQMMRESRHTLGNHGYDHLDGWRCDNAKYLANVKRGMMCTPSPYYRPPYGRMSPCQWRELRTLKDLVMWDVMPGDFDPKVGIEACVTRTLESVSPGSIIVLHDNDKSHDTMINAVPEIILGIQAMGLNFKSLPPEGLGQSLT
jgi:peptidoglycan/xylan/chitin deacetylase (PgdA/CDA1 family)